MSKYDKASLVMIPSAVKAETLYSVLPVNGNGDFTHDRNAGTATRVNKEGLIETVSADVPRLDYPLIDGVVQDCPALLLEPARTNLITYSEEFDNANWLKSLTSVTANQTISPDGLQTADILTKNADYGSISKTGISATSGSDYTFSVFVKKGTTNFLSIRQTSGSNDVRKQFNLTTGEVTNGLAANQTGFVSSKFEDYSNGWYRLSITCTSNGTSITASIYSGKVGESTFNGDSYIWGAQLEAGSYPTSYIPNDGTTATVTRNADVCNSAGTSAEFNDSEGVVYLELKPIAFDSTHKRVVVSDGTITNRIIMGIDSYNNVLATVYNGSNQAILGGNYDGKENFQKVALKYKANDFSLYFNGFEVATDSSGVTYSANTLTQISYEDANNTLNFYGRIKETGVFKEALTDSELEALTSWDSFNDMATSQEYSIK